MIYIVIYDHPKSLRWTTFLQWQRTNGISLIYFAVRWSILVFFVTTWLISLIQAELNTESNARWLIYLTNWGYTLCTAQAILSVIMITSALLSERRSCTKEDYLTGKLYKVYWAVNGIATVVAFGITILFWSLIYEGMKCFHFPPYVQVRPKVPGTVRSVVVRIIFNPRAIWRFPFTDVLRKNYLPASVLTYFNQSSRGSHGCYTFKKQVCLHKYRPLSDKDIYQAVDVLIGSDFFKQIAVTSSEMRDITGPMIFCNLVYNLSGHVCT